jgi:hypothetical protein
MDTLPRAFAGACKTAPPACTQGNCLRQFPWLVFEPPQQNRCPPTRAQNAPKFPSEKFRIPHPAFLIIFPLFYKKPEMYYNESRMLEKGPLLSVGKQKRNCL